MKVDFKTGGTWRRVGQCTLIMNSYDFFILLSRLVSKRRHINKNREVGRFFLICHHFEIKRLSQINKFINIHYQCSLSDPTPSASSLKINFFGFWHLVYMYKPKDQLFPNPSIIDNSNIWRLKHYFTRMKCPKMQQLIQHHPIKESHQDRTKKNLMENYYTMSNFGEYST